MRPFRTTNGWILATVLLAPTNAPAQPVPLDPVEVQANAHISGLQIYPAIAVRADGSFVLVWTSSTSGGTDSDGSSIQARRFSADGEPLDAAEFQVNTYTPGPQDSPSVAADASGGFVVVWESYGSSNGDPDGSSVQARRFDADGEPIDASEFLVNQSTVESQRWPDVAARDDGAFVVSWTDNYGMGFYEIRARRFDADGTALDPVDLAVNAQTTDGQLYSAIDVDSQGRFVVTWDNGWIPLVRGPNEIRARRFASDGTPRDAADLVVFVDEPAEENYPDVVVEEDGGFVVVWSGTAANPAGRGGPGIGIWLQRYDSNGTPVHDDPLRVSSYTPWYQISPSVARHSAGGLVVVWSSSTAEGPGPDYDVWGRRLGADDVALEPTEFQLNTGTAGYQINPVVGVAESGDFVVSWASTTSAGGDSDLYSVQARRFRGIPLFADGFELGDATRWSSVVP